MTGPGQAAPGAAAQPVQVVVEAAADEGELTRLWASVGYDEINWTYTPRGRDLLATLAGLGDGPYLVRSHYMFNSGTALGLPHWGAGNVYHERADGTPWFDFQVLDRAYDALVEAGHIPLVELGFTPRALVPDDAGQRFAFQPGSPTQYSEYEAGWWSFPPKSVSRWAGLVRAVEKPVLGAYRLLGRLGRRRLRATSSAAWPVRLIDEAESVPEEVDVLAAGSGYGQVSVLVWRRDDDQHRQGGGERPVRVSVRGLADGPVLIRHWRIDATHGNAHQAWQALGAPDYPGQREIEEMAARGRLRPFEPERLETATGGEITLDLSLGLPAVSLLELAPAQRQ